MTDLLAASAPQAPLAAQPPALGPCPEEPHTPLPQTHTCALVMFSVTLLSVTLLSVTLPLAMLHSVPAPWVTVWCLWWWAEPRCLCCADCAVCCCAEWCVCLLQPPLNAAYALHALASAACSLLSVLWLSIGGLGPRIRPRSRAAPVSAQRRAEQRIAHGPGGAGCCACRGA